MNDRKAAKLYHHSNELKATAEILDVLNSHSDDDFGFFGELELYWADVAMGKLLVAEDTDTWFYEPYAEVAKDPPPAE